MPTKVIYDVASAGELCSVSQENGSAAVGCLSGASALAEKEGGDGTISPGDIHHLMRATHVVFVIMKVFPAYSLQGKYLRFAGEVIVGSSVVQRMGVGIFQTNS